MERFLKMVPVMAALILDMLCVGAAGGSCCRVALPVVPRLLAKSVLNPFVPCIYK
jgi:hypothetical protein